MTYSEPGEKGPTQGAADDLAIKMAERVARFLANDEDGTRHAVLGAALEEEDDDLRKALDNAEAYVREQPELAAAWEGETKIKRDERGRFSTVEKRRGQMDTAAENLRKTYEELNPNTPEAKRIYDAIKHLDIARRVHHQHHEYGKSKVEERAGESGEKGWQALSESPGFTMATYGTAPRKGYAFSPYPDRETKIPMAEVTPEHIARFVHDNADLLAQREHYIGGWIDGGHLYLDVTVVGEPGERTLQMARDADQLAVYDLEAGETIRTGHERERAQTPEASARAVSGAARHRVPAGHAPRGDPGDPQVRGRWPGRGGIRGDRVGDDYTRDEGGRFSKVERRGAPKQDEGPQEKGEGEPQGEKRSWAESDPQRPGFAKARYGDLGRAVGKDGSPISGVELANRVETTEALFYNKDTGEWHPRRAALHAKWQEEQLQGAKSGQSNPVCHFMGGGTAAGKSSTLKAGLVKLPESPVKVDADDAKQAIPEYKDLLAAGDARGAAFVHEESSAMGKALNARALEEKYNVVLDGTADSSWERMKQKVEAVRKAGYQARATYCTCPTDEAISRMEARAQKTGRYVPPSVVRALHANVSAVARKALEEGLFDHCEVYDTSGPRGSKPRLLAVHDGKRLVIHDKEGLDAFFAKAAGET